MRLGLPGCGRGMVNAARTMALSTLAACRPTPFCVSTFASPSTSCSSVLPASSLARRASAASFACFDAFSAAILLRTVSRTVSSGMGVAALCSAIRTTTTWPGATSIGSELLFCTSTLSENAAFTTSGLPAMPSPPWRENSGVFCTGMPSSLAADSSEDGSW